MDENAEVWRIWSKASKLRNVGMEGIQAITYTEWIMICEANDLTLDDLNKLLILEESILPIIRNRAADENNQKRGNQ